jgi:protein CpxP
MSANSANRPANRILVALAATFVGAALTLGSPGPLHAADPAPAAPAAASPAGAPTRLHNVEARIKHLHDQLKIKPDQETQWSAVAQVMRDNAAALDSAIQARVQKASGMSAIDDIRSYQAIAAAHAEGLQKFADAFAPLYEAMPDAQRTNADRVFGHRTAPSKLKAHG